jgi:hypothetical protein
MNARLLLLLLPITATLGCAGEIGEACDKSGAVSECVDSAICTTDSRGTYCRQRCTDTAQCVVPEQCNGVSGTNIKSCQP